MCRKLYILSVWLLLIVIATSCHKEDEYDNTINGNFEALWKTLDQHYCFFEEKHINWDSIGEVYRKELYSYQQIKAGEYFDICSRMLNELQDGHVNLISAFNVGAYRQWWTDYPQNFNLRTLQQYYLGFDYSQVGSFVYKVLDDDIGYIYYSSFSSNVSDALIDSALETMSECKGLIIDVRNNGGGTLTNIRPFVGRFIETDIIGGYILHKTGPGHTDFSDPYPVVYHPVDATHKKWHKPIVVLTNRACFSAANEFVGVMKQLPGVIIMGARTGGGGGMPFSAELPIGWTVRFSASPMLDATGKSIESGIDPTPGYEVTSTAEALAAGHDNILDTAIRYLKLLPAKNISKEPKKEVKC